MNTTGRISISAFYKRRIARIFPVFYLYIATIAILTAFNVFHVSFLAFCAASSFAWNFSRMWEHLGSLGNADVLAHFWTLSIEEQFYLFWPSVLVLFGRRGAMRVALLCVVLFPVVRVAEYHSVLAADAGSLVHDDPAYVVYHEFSQDLILWGALGAFALRSEWFKQRAARGFWWKALSAGMLILGAAEVALRRFPDYTLTVSLESTVQALGVLLVMFWLLAAEGGIVRRLLEARPVVQIGLLSYSLYVWQQLYVHWPGRSLVFPVTLLLIVVTAVASYYLVEVPARKRIRHWFSQLQPAHNNSLAV
jgi:peptidoglycan/LPS O-acetylase OafA/YrhL